MVDPTNLPPETIFIRARFAGGRFDAHTMPLEVLPDLASYQRLIVEVAKHLFKTSHGNRVRVPKGFEQSFGIALAKVEGGNSSTAELVRVEYAEQQYQASLAPKYPEFEDARDLVFELIRRVSKGEELPDRFPPDLVGLFNPFGQSLRQDEFIDISAPTQASVRYTDNVRRAIVLSAEKTYEKTIDDEFTLNGGVVDTATIHVRDGAGKSLDFQPTTQFEFDEAYRRAKGRVRLVGSGMFDATDTLKRLLSVNAHFDRPAFHLDVERAFEEMRAAALDGAGNLKLVHHLDRLKDLLIENSDPNLEIGVPFVYLLEDGEISVEWSHKAWEANIELDASGTLFKFHALNMITSRSIWAKVRSDELGNLARAFQDFFAGVSVDVDGGPAANGEA